MLQRAISLKPDTLNHLIVDMGAEITALLHSRLFLCKGFLSVAVEPPPAWHQSTQNGFGRGKKTHKRQKRAPNYANNMMKEREATLEGFRLPSPCTFCGRK